jgi:hypothetical protein
MEELNPEVKSSDNKAMLSKIGFDFSFSTNLYKTKTGTVYYFCYDQGYLPLDNDYYMLVSRNTGSN